MYKFFSDSANSLTLNFFTSTRIDSATREIHLIFSSNHGRDHHSEMRSSASRTRTFLIDSVRLGRGQGDSAEDESGDFVAPITLTATSRRTVTWPARPGQQRRLHGGWGAGAARPGIPGNCLPVDSNRRSGCTDTCLTRIGNRHRAYVANDEVANLQDTTPFSSSKRPLTLST